MSNFKGTINGVAYTDKGAFYAALKSLKHRNQLHVHVEENNEPKQEEKREEPQVHQNYDQLLAQALGMVFGSFLKAQNPSLYNKINAQKGQRPLQELPNSQRAPLSYENLLRKYFFKETTYQFTGGAEDEFHLDQFSGLLKRLGEQIKSENLTHLNYQQKETLYNLTIRNYNQIQKNIKVLDEQMHRIDARMASLENILNAYEAAKIVEPGEIQGKYNEAKLKFDIFQNKVNYYRLLLEHCRNIGPYFDPAL